MTKALCCHCNSLIHISWVVWELRFLGICLSSECLNYLGLRHLGNLSAFVFRTHFCWVFQFLNYLFSWSNTHEFNVVSLAWCSSFTMSFEKVIVDSISFTPFMTFAGKCWIVLAIVCSPIILLTWYQTNLFSIYENCAFSVLVHVFDDVNHLVWYPYVSHDDPP